MLQVCSSKEHYKLKTKQNPTQSPFGIYKIKLLNKNIICFHKTMLHTVKIKNKSKLFLIKKEKLSRSPLSRTVLQIIKGKWAFTDKVCPALTFIVAFAVMLFLQYFRPRHLFNDFSISYWLSASSQKQKNQQKPRQHFHWHWNSGSNSSLN